MGYSIKNNLKFAVMKEVTEGVYVAPASGADFIQVLQDGAEMTPSREVLERNVLGTGLARVAPRAGLKSVSGSIPVEMKSGSTEGAVPEWGVILESLMGAKRNSAAITTGTGHTTSVINVSSTANLKVGDVVTIEQSGAYHSSPIASLVANTSITLLVPMTDAPDDNVVISAFQTYTMAESGHPTLSVSKYVENAILEKAMGCRATSMSLDNFTTAQIASLAFGYEGLDFDRLESAPAFTPSFDTSETPTIINACIYQNGTEIYFNELSLSIENTIGFIQNTCDGKTGSRITARSVSGSMNPFKQNDNIDNYNNFNQNLPFSLYVTAKNPTAVEGEYHQSVSFYLPYCKITELGEGDNDGVLVDQISFSANTENGTLGEVYITVS